MTKNQKNNLRRINEVIFRAIDRLDDDSLNSEAMANEIARANAISSASKVVIQTVKVKVDIAKLKGGKKILDDVGLDYE